MVIMASPLASHLPPPDETPKRNKLPGIPLQVNKGMYGRVSQIELWGEGGGGGGGEREDPTKARKYGIGRCHLSVSETITTTNPTLVQQKTEP